MCSFRKLYLSILAFVLLASPMQAQTSWLESLGLDFDFDIPKPVVTYKDLIDVGSARHLSGSVCVLYLFVGTETSKWSQEEIEATAQKLYAAEDWLKAEALRYDKKVEFRNYSIKRQLTDNNIPDNPFQPDAVDYPKTVLRRFGYNSNRELHDILTRKTGCHQFLVLVFAHVPGRCYASAVNRNMARNGSGRSLPESCMLYQISNDTGRELQVGRIAHEMLHLFGAWDFYAVNANDKERSERAAELYPNSIMLRSYGDINQRTIDPLTAWLIGLSRKEQDWYQELMPPMQ
ncbi:MAG: hypothetical protein J5543_07540 [Bacteroidales bacterium]|nr:hypothetical protein [Bacteroidales bacterium]